MSVEKKRIAIITERIYPFYHGGSEEVMYNYAKALSTKYDVSVFTSFDFGDARSDLENVKFNNISKRIKSTNRKGAHSLLGVIWFSISISRSRRLIAGFDIILLDSIHYFYPKSLLKFLKKRNNKIITVFHEAWYKYRESGTLPSLLTFFMGISIKLLIRYSNTIISVSDPTTNSLINNYGAEKDKVVTIPLGISYKDIKNQNSFKDVSDRKYDLVFVGRFAAIKRVSDIVDAVSILVRQGKHLEVALIGDGPQRELVERKIYHFRLSGTFHTFGFLNENEKYSTLANSKIFILPSEREGFSLSTLEAMSSGCIPIVSKPKFDEVFGVSHFVKNNENGIYYNVGNVDELAKAISGLLDNSELSKLLSSNAMKTAKLYTISDMSSRIYDTLERVLS
jgi:glycosyltransferase involved in cell wall biosynthesis